MIAVIRHPNHHYRPALVTINQSLELRQKRALQRSILAIKRQDNDCPLETSRGNCPTIQTLQRETDWLVLRLDGVNLAEQSGKSQRRAKNENQYFFSEFFQVVPAIHNLRLSLP